MLRPSYAVYVARYSYVPSSSVNRTTRASSMPWLSAGPRGISTRSCSADDSGELDGVVEQSAIQVEAVDGAHAGPAREALVEQVRERLLELGCG